MARLTMLCCKFLGCGARRHISDWLEHDQSSFVCWHGGMCPTCLTSDTGDGGGPRIRPHFNNKKPAVVDARVPIMDLCGNQTVRRLNSRASAQVDATLKPGMDVRHRAAAGSATASSHAACESFQWTATPSTRLSRSLSRHDLQRPVEAREATAVGQQRR